MGFILAFKGLKAISISLSMENITIFFSVHSGPYSDYPYSANFPAALYNLSYSNS
jgi:hypothetical protein